MLWKRMVKRTVLLRHCLLTASKATADAHANFLNVICFLFSSGLRLDKTKIIQHLTSQTSIPDTLAIPWIFNPIQVWIRKKMGGGVTPILAPRNAVSPKL